MTPSDALAIAFDCLAAGAADRRSAFHTPTLATRALDGAPSLRTVVLRRFDRAARVVSLHTDRRSPKAAEIAAEPRVALHGYDAGRQVQLRLAGAARLHVDGALVEAAWAASRATSRATYATAQGPGAPVPAPPPAPRDTEAGRAHFAVVTLRIDALDWLQLAAEGHRRARFAWDPAGVLSAGWVAP
ncbi:pyridoxamine 5'-phosphate oxidase family protein [Roseomonas sp. CECT 9278]|uniref:pyridoxamine 5'-phosphate oxidase family protein n=1 Tax=Roseomonas sp. CECT 9278 TaxID=2845823 RepID=UPI001E2B4C32|nr:pyridoxamine 5'-phosphate oxidase family protein [Roseomonas sp. CECT 9278]CAH0268244.1 hypothetical protein ROS9278_03587 [Roseomonas sp. CECT 9278]